MTEVDPIIERLREQISDNDRRLADALNRRLELVAELKRYKDSRGIDFVDAEREAHLLDELGRANAGPLSDAELRAFFVDVLALTKREVS